MVQRAWTVNLNVQTVAAFPKRLSVTETTIVEIQVTKNPAKRIQVCQILSTSQFRLTTLLRWSKSSSLNFHSVILIIIILDISRCPWFERSLPLLIPISQPKFPISVMADMQ